MSTNALPPINQALLPANIRNGNTAAKNAYREGLAFEQVLVSQLAQQLAKGLDATASVAGSDGSTGLDGSSGSDASTTDAYTQMLPGALTSSIMSGGGLGVAAQIAAALDPAINDPVKK